MMSFLKKTNLASWFQKLISLNWLWKIVSLTQVVAVAIALVDQHPVFQVGYVAFGVAPVNPRDVAGGIQQDVDFRFLHFHSDSSLQVGGCFIQVRIHFRSFYVTTDHKMMLSNIKC